MYLMNVPPVAATHTKWRTCGPSPGYSLPVCFNDSDTELSTRDTPISNKVQMIIESLRSTQSSNDMGDEIDGIVLPGEEGHPQVPKGPSVGPQSKTRSLTQSRQDAVDVNHDGHESDSDDSVDRGIEEAILEYLKEKDAHKCKAESRTTPRQTFNIPMKTLPPEDSRHNSESATSTMKNNQFPKSDKSETPTATAFTTMNTCIKTEADLDENAVTKMDLVKSTISKSTTLPIEMQRGPCKTSNLSTKVTVKMDEDSGDSSSDDGIEEAIQMYQLEKKTQQDKQEASKAQPLKEESDSTSDDGIEEAIRCYQLEQLKEKNAVKPFINKQKPLTKSLINKSMERRKINRLTKKKTKTALSSLSSVCTPKNTLSEIPSNKGSGLISLKVERLKEHHSPAPTKVNTTAELMCAEAILDISKAVMPGAFLHNVGLSSCAPIGTVSLSGNRPHEGSDDSSVDSEEGIEQEIRNFLEQKAKMHSQSPSCVKAVEQHTVSEPADATTKGGTDRKKPIRLSLTQKRKLKDQMHVSNMPLVANKRKDAAVKSLPKYVKESGQRAFSLRSQTQPVASEKSGEKSSSLDSDEDLDTAIKDLLKTKKKMKKKDRDLKRKLRGLMDDGPLLESTLWSKKVKPDSISKCGSLKRDHKRKNDIRDKSRLNTRSMFQHKNTKRNGDNENEGEMEIVKESGDRGIQLICSPQDTLKADSSSVDSDDSIEQEIRKFLAEKAKSSSADKAKDGATSENTPAVTCPLFKNEDTKRGNQEADVSPQPLTVLPVQMSLTSPEIKDIKQENREVDVSPQPVTPLLVQTLLTGPETKDIKQENQVAEISPQLVTSLLVETPLAGLETKSQDRLPFLGNPVSALGQSQLSSVLTSSSGSLEPADGAGAARTERRRFCAGREGMERVWTLPDPNIVQPNSASIKWRQSLGLPAVDTRTLSRTLFHITSSSKMAEIPSTTSQCVSGGTSLKSETSVIIWPTPKTNKPLAPFVGSAETSANATLPSPGQHLLSPSRQHQSASFARTFVSGGQRAQWPMEGDAERMVQITKDQSVFVKLESNRTNHVQVRSREMCKGKAREDFVNAEKREGESKKMGEKEIHLERLEEDFIDESDSEADKRKDPEKQGVSTLSLSRAIDPGITLKPCIALTTEERSKRFSRRYMAENIKKVNHSQRL
ncbi:protein phosphatase 1 regulatory subunit 26 isoform X2 [Thalassophryne amazonica]|uniref:protein phosphatase 1 regulatory subunit 26 isoform X2 n=1 Tax=Thalassophryne amazonica TaxID=390379 RepID=UPI001471561F|nr:protein phosphatase 1 regulatory subunit 26 isoform X2 [Thalassophryne amazonica]